VRRLVIGVALVSWLSFAEWKIFERLLYSDRASVDFVLESVRGILAGTPVSRSWQHRFLGPIIVSGLARLTHDPQGALELFHAIMLGCASLLLFALLRRRGFCQAMVAVVVFGFAHILLAYKLEYPWDWIDMMIFIGFGWWAARGGGLLAMVPLLALGAFNHETILYLPLWYLLTRNRKQWLGAGAAAVVLGGAMIATRALFYKGQPNLPGQVFEPLTPVISNHLHAAHNLANLFFWNWIVGRAHLSILVLAAVALCVWLALRSQYRRAAIWSLCVIATIVCFGYINETRHYLPLIAFWVPYAFPNTES
jgi:hypothetical protein